MNFGGFAEVLNYFQTWKFEKKINGPKPRGWLSWEDGCGLLDELGQGHNGGGWLAHWATRRPSGRGDWAVRELSSADRWRAAPTDREWARRCNNTWERDGMDDRCWHFIATELSASVQISIVAFTKEYSRVSNSQGSSNSIISIELKKDKRSKHY
jgi:hypothetical protein